MVSGTKEGQSSQIPQTLKDNKGILGTTLGR